jgi:hypothetical protein
MTKEEKRDMYIAAAVGGVALVLILLYIKTPPDAGQPASLPEPAATLAGAGDQNPYNYNIQPYGGSGSPLYVPSNGLVKPPGSGNGSGGGCCNECGTGEGGSYENPGVLAYLKLLAMGAI